MAWTKVYWCPRGDVDRSSVTAKLVGPEIVGPTDWYSLVMNVAPPNTSPNWNWTPGVRSPLGYSTQLKFPKSSPNKLTNQHTGIFIGWRTSDNQCVLFEMRWDNGDAVNFTEAGGNSGGGMAFYDETTEKLTVAIINDHQNSGSISLTGVSCALLPVPLELPGHDHPHWRDRLRTPTVSVVPLLDLSTTTVPALDDDPVREPIRSLGYTMVPWPAGGLRPGEYVAFRLKEFPHTAAFAIWKTDTDPTQLWWAEQITPRAD